MRLRETLNGTTIADRLLLIVLILVSFLGFVFVKDVLSHGTDVRIEVNGKLAYKLPIDIDRTVSVKGAIGSITVEIKDKKVRIKESPCQNKICIHHGWIDKGAVVCLPNRVMVIIGSPEENRNKTVDATTG